jgi:hypothetical protein
MPSHVRGTSSRPSGTCRGPRSRAGSEPGRSVGGDRRLAGPHRCRSLPERTPAVLRRPSSVPVRGERSEPLMRSSVSPSHTNDENGERRTSHSEPVRGHEKVPAYSHPAPVARPGAGDRSTVPRPFTGPARQPSATGSARPRENSGTVQPPGLRSRPWPVTPIVARARPSRAKAGNGSRARPDDYR